jgi:uncharacterized protein YdiU (UPF0061 family)
LKEIFDGFSGLMQTKMQQMWAAKLGLNTFDDALFSALEKLMAQTPVDYSMFFRELSAVPDNIAPLLKSFYQKTKPTYASSHSKDSTPFTSSNPSTHSAHKADTIEVDPQWVAWFAQWHAMIDRETDPQTGQPKSRETISNQMKSVNPKYTLREIFLVPAYQQAALGNYDLVRELQEVITQPYADQSQTIQEKYDRLKPSELFQMGGLSHYSCSS